VARARSDDAGKTWRNIPHAEFHLPPDIELDGWGEYAGWPPDVRLLLENRGTLTTLREGKELTTATVKTREDGVYRQMLFSSEDGGGMWSFVSLVQQGPPDHHAGYVEPAMIELQGGTLLLVCRTAYHRPERLMMQCRSVDGGRTWSAPAPTPGIPPRLPVRIQRPIRNEGKMYSNAASVSPWLAQLPSGVIALTYGRPGVKIAFSEDGSGRCWTDILQIVPEESVFGVNDTGSHMSGITTTANPDELLLLYDVWDYQAAPGDEPQNTIFALTLTVRRQ
jgi:hypothetical protein